MRTLALVLAVVGFGAATARADGPVRAGARTPTVFVPVIKDPSLTRLEALARTELLIKAIERATPYRVVGSPEGADFTLTLTPAARPGPSRGR